MPLHLAHHVAAEVGQAAGVGVVGGRVGPADVAVVGQRHVPDAERVQHAEHAERAADGSGRLRRRAARPPGRPRSPLHVVRGQRELQRLRVARDHPAGQVDLLEHRGDRAVAGRAVPGRRPTRTGAPTPPATSRGMSVCRPATGAARSTAVGSPGRWSRHFAGTRAPGPRPAVSGPARSPGRRDRPRQVVVPVDQREPAEHGPRLGSESCGHRRPSHAASVTASAIVAAASASLTRREHPAPSSISAAATRTPGGIRPGRPGWRRTRRGRCRAARRPAAPPACRSVFNRVEAWPVSAADTVARAAVCDGRHREPEKAAGAEHQHRHGPARVARPGERPSATIGTTAPSMPAIISRRGPTRLYSRDVTWMPTMPPRASGNVDRPECRAEKPRPFCRQQRNQEQVPTNRRPRPT